MFATPGADAVGRIDQYGARAAPTSGGGSHGSIPAIARRVRSANYYPSFVTSQNTGTVVSPSPDTFVRTAVYCFHCPPLMYGTDLVRPHLDLVGEPRAFGFVGALPPAAAQALELLVAGKAGDVVGARGREVDVW